MSKGQFVTIKAKILKVLPLLATVWGASAVWVIASPPLRAPTTPIKVSKEYLSQNITVLRHFFSESKEPPISLNHLRLWAISKGLQFHSYDGFAERFDYQRLSDKEYYIRSFGKKGQEANMLQSPNPAYLRWGKRAEVGIRYKFPNNPQLKFYPAVMLASSESPNGVWRAKMFVDAATHKKHLIVRDSRQKNLFMVAEHDAVEEYLWLSSGYEIIFSATSSENYRDGIYLWNLTTGEHTNLIDKLGRDGPVPPSDTGLKIHVSLSGIDVTGPTVFAFVGENLGGPVDPFKFYSTNNFYGIQIPDERGAKLSLKNYSAIQLPSPFSVPLNLSDNLEISPKVLKTQQNWLSLPHSGAIETVLTDWQSFLANDSTQSLMPYGLWYLSLLYNQAYLAHPKLDPKDRDILRTYGSEIAHTLANLKTAPSYLRAMAKFVAYELMSSRPLSMTIAEFTPLAAPPQVMKKVEKSKTNIQSKAQKHNNALKTKKLSPKKSSQLPKAKP